MSLAWVWGGRRLAVGIGRGSCAGANTVCNLAGLLAHRWAIYRFPAIVYSHLRREEIELRILLLQGHSIGKRGSPIAG